MLIIQPNLFMSHVSLIAAIDRRMEIPYLRLRLLRMVSQYNSKHLSVHLSLHPTTFAHPLNLLFLPSLPSTPPLNSLPIPFLTSPYQ